MPIPKFKGILKNERELRKFYGVDLINSNALVLFSGQLEWREFKLKTFCQSTGLFDKNKKEIYEGDILYFANDKKTCKVVYHNGAFGVDYYYDSYPTHLFHWYDFVDTSHEKIIPEIIGNIHQNPELLNKQYDTNSI